MPVVSEYESHDITKKFRYATFFPFARSVSAVEDKPEGITINILAKTSPNSWSERQLEQKQVTFDKEIDVSGPLSVAAVVTIEEKREEKSKTEEEKEKTEENVKAGEKKRENTEAEKEKDVEKEMALSSEGRISVFGDSDFVTNRYYGLSGNGNFFLNTVNWLTEEADLIAIQPKTSSPRSIHLTPTQGRMIFFVSLIILPLIILIIGISVWVRRRAL
jgi:ABC-type uncharacterized transport system involved in gliding motility auxiliary subunit